MPVQGNLARLFDLSASSLDLSLSGSGYLVYLHGNSLGDLAVAQNLNQVGGMLDDALGDQRLAVYGFASLEVLLDAGNIDGQILNMVDVAEARQLGKTTCQGV